MSMQFSSIFSTQFNSAIPHPELILIRHLKQCLPDHQIVPTTAHDSSSFPLSAYLSSIGVEIELDPAHNDFEYNFDSSKDQNKIWKNVVAGEMTFTYEGVPFRAFKVSWLQDNSEHFFYGLTFVAQDDTVGQKLATEVYKHGDALKEEIWVYEGGRWRKSRQLYQAIRESKWDDVVLHDSFKEGLKRDTETFFSSKDVYRSLGITWKRGILLLGPPGNGKTESIKALLNEFEYEALYVKSFSTPYGPEYGVRQIFDKARQHSPCILVLEDLDSMVTEKVRSFFLNEMDGLAQNDGMLTIATTNHPERIDDAILNRPSRFDVKYDFALPDEDLRKEFARKWIGKIEKLSGRDVIFETDTEVLSRRVSEKTAGWTFAFLKELFVSFLLRIAHDSSLKHKGAKTNGTNGTTSPRNAGETLLNQIDVLSAQILRLKKAENVDDADDADERWCPPLPESTGGVADGPTF
ncbi:P-loop containing nucleoside triphosphate hydrolase protein [Panus rudis PR-1116 ss-1]|nr:P-loop containing nucleoside triphosphate hydrolase protein [Panus rudis PR-1116 ss-1]